MPRVSFHTLGCKLNYAETSTMARDFTARGYESVAFSAPADVCVINTCSVTEQAESKCRNAIRRALRANPEAFVVVTGCYAQLRPEEIAAIPGVDAVLGAQEKFRLLDLVDASTKRTKTQIEVSCIDEVTAFGPSYSAGDRTRAFLKVQDGCDYTCAFCTIPQARGRSRSHDLDATVAQARAVAALGYREIVLSGINIGLYGLEHGVSLLDLVRRLDAEVDVDRFRISSIEPNLLTDELIDFVASSRAFQPHFHIPLQSGDDFVLGKMRRRYRRADYAARVARILDRMPDACTGVDVIVGFPAEDEERFAQTVAFLDELPVGYLHVFTYSERPGTAAVEQAGRMGGASVPKSERARRSRVLRLLSEKKRHAFTAGQLGRERPALWEDDERDGDMFGWTDNYVRVRAPFDPDRVNTIERVVLDGFAEDGTVRVADPAYVSLLAG